MMKMKKSSVTMKVKVQITKAMDRPMTSMEKSEGQELIQRGIGLKKR